MNAYDPYTVLENEYRWYVIPHGLNPDDTTKLRVSVRVVPQFTSADGETVDSFARRAAGQLLRDWPAFIARGITLRIAACKADNTEPQLTDTTFSLNFTADWHTCLAQWGVSPAQASELWKSIVRPELHIKTCTPKSAKIMTEVPHTAGAQILRNVLGGIYSTGLQEAYTSRQGALRTMMPGQIDLTSRQKQEGLLMPLCGILGTLKPVRITESKEQEWYLQRLRLAGINPAPSQLKKFIDHSSALNEQKYDVFPKYFNDLSDYILYRYLTLIPELSPAPSPQKDEFHSELAKLTLHPWLLQSVGLSISSEIDVSRLACPNAMALCVASIDCAGNHLKPAHGVKVVCCLDKTNPYFPAERPASSSRYTHGCVNLTASDGNGRIFTLEQLDTDSLSEKLVQAAQNLNTQLDAGVSASQRVISMPPLQTTGISLLMKGTAKQMFEQQQRLVLCAGAWQTVYAEDLIIGYRPDIAPLEPDNKGGTCPGLWKSLTGRKLESLRTGGRDWSKYFANPLSDEGIVTLAVRKLQTSPAKDTRIPFEEVFRWEGWSLAVNNLECHPNHPRQTNARLAIDYRSNGCLPKLRVGWGYRIGMRAVYLDGRSLSLDEARQTYQQYPHLTLGTLRDVEKKKDDKNKNEDSSFLPFWRYEPILAPVPLLNHKLDRRALPTQRVDFLAIASQRRGKPDITATERILVPPRVDLQAAIRLGMFDGEHTHIPKSAFAGVILNANGSFPSAGNTCLFGLFGDEPTGDICYTKDRDALPPKVPYLPDPWAQRMVIGIYRSDNKLLALEYHDYYSPQHCWPNCNPLTLRLESASLETLRSEGYDLEWGDSTLVVKVAPGIALQVCCWHEITEQMLANSGIIEMMANFAEKDKSCAEALYLSSDGPKVDIRDQLIQCLSQWHLRRAYQLQPYLASGQPARSINLTSFSMLNPVCHLQLAHLVPLPVRAPQFCEAKDLTTQTPRSAILPVRNSGIAERFNVDRELYGQTIATFKGDIEFHRASTVRLECFAQWQEFDDQVASSLQKQTQRHSLFTLEAIPPALRGEESDPALDQDLLLLHGERTTLEGGINVDLQAHFADPNKEQWLLQYDFLDARARLVTFDLRATSRFLKHLSKDEQDLYSDSGPQTSRWVKATKPPAPPVIAYVVPLLQSAKRSQPGLQVHERRGNWIRIWLERPWYSSGEGELLALVCWPGDLFRPRGGTKDYLVNRVRRAWGSVPEPTYDSVPSRLRALYTGWGHDPIWEQKSDLGMMPPGAFANRIDVGVVKVIPSQLLAGRAPDENKEKNKDKSKDKDEDIHVSLALYQPLYHAAEQRWYVDIHITPDNDAYYPFIRLCLARYQPNAIAGCELSEIVSSEFVQLLPERVASIQANKDDNGVTRIRVSIAGPASLRLSEFANQAATQTDQVNRMLIRVERAHGDPHQATAWLPVHDEQKKEVTELSYRDGLWSLPPHQKALYKLDDDTVYSVYLEEYQVVMVDDDEPDSSVYPHQPNMRCSERLVYVDRLMLPSRI